MSYKYTDSTNTVVHVINEDGISRSSMLATSLPEGTEILPADVPVPVIPAIVSMRQARLALLQFSLLATVDAAIAQGTDADKIEWEYAAEVNRNTPLVQNMKVGLSLSESDLDNLFTLASTL